MSDIKFDLDGAGGAKIRSFFSRLSDPEPVLRDFGEYKRRRIVMAMPMMSRSERSTPGQPPAKRSGLLSQRITYNVEAERLEVGTYDVRGRILQEGGIIRPRTAKALAVPIHKDARGKRPRDFDDLQYSPRKDSGKPPLLVRPRGKARSGEPRAFDLMFVLLKSVTIKARPFLWWDEQDRGYLLTALQRQFEAAS